MGAKIWRGNCWVLERMHEEYTKRRASDGEEHIHRGATTYKGHGRKQGSINGAFLEPLHLACLLLQPLTLNPKEVAHQPISKHQ